MTSERRADARIDPDKKHPHTGLDAIPEAQVFKPW
jgi:hypothetical protein